MDRKGDGKGMKKAGRVLAVSAGALLAAAGIAVGVFAYKVIIGATYRTDDVADYGEFEGFQGYSQLLIFPEELLESAEPETYVYRYGDRLFDPECQIFLECTYGKEDFQKELERLDRLRNLEYDTENFKYPAYVKTNGREHCYEYALIADEDTIVYVFLQYMRRDEIRFSWDYLPNNYERKKPEPEAKIKGLVFVSFNGEIQGFEADSSGMLRNIEQLAYLAPRGGLGMEEEAENVPTDSNPCLSESAGMRDMDEILTSESGLTWVSISGRSSADSGEGTSVPEHGDIAAYVQEEDLYIAKETGEKDLWNIWKLPGYGEWMEQEIRIFLRVMTGMEAAAQTHEMDEFAFFDKYSGFLDDVENIEAVLGWEQDDSRATLL